MIGLFVCLTVILTVILFSVLLLAKNANTFRQRTLICTAVRDYRLDLIARGAYDVLTDSPVDYDDMESYDRTLWRLWDWGYKRILLRDKYIYIKPYIDKINDRRETQ